MSSTATSESLAEPEKPAPKRTERSKRTGLWIAGGLLLGILCGVLFGEYCAGLQIVGRAYVGLLQMTVLPYLAISLVAKMGRLDVQKARQLGLTALAVLLVLWLIGIALIVLVSGILPPMEGASFYSPASDSIDGNGADFLSRFIPTNIFRSLSDEYVPAVVVFCLFFGSALMMVPGKEPVLDFLDLCSTSLGRINHFLVRLAPLGLFALTAAAAGTLGMEELSRLQGYLLMFLLACLAASVGVLPILVSSLTPIRYRDFLRATFEPTLIAIATGKLFVVLPQITENCEQLLSDPEDESDAASEESTASVLVPLAYPFPHLGKTLAFVFISFAAWYSGQRLTPPETAGMAATGTISSFASPLITVPYLLDQHRLPQDLMSLFILPGFITTRVADVVGVVHLMALTVLVTLYQRGQLRIRWNRLAASTLALLACLAIGGAAGRWYLASTTLEYDLDKRLLSLEIPSAHTDVMVYRNRSDAPSPPATEKATLARIKTQRVLRVGYSPDSKPYCFFNGQQQLVGMEVELLHRLASRMQWRLEFVPYTASTAEELLATGEIDLLIGGVMMTPERLLRVDYTHSYDNATLAVVARDHRRGEFDRWDQLRSRTDLALGVIHEDLAARARVALPNAAIEVVDSFRPFFEGKAEHLDGLIMSAEAGSVWNILYPSHTIIVPQPIVRRPVAMVVRTTDGELRRFLDHWLEFERLDGALDRIRMYWVEGGGTREQPPRWCVLRDVLHWLP